MYGAASCLPPLAPKPSDPAQAFKIFANGSKAQLCDGATSKATAAGFPKAFSAEPPFGGGGVFAASPNLASFLGLESFFSFFETKRRPSSLSPHDNHYWSVRLDEALAEHGAAGLQPAPLGTRAVRWLDGVRDKRRGRRRKKRRGGEEEAASPSFFAPSDGASGVSGGAPSSHVDVELAPLWGVGGGGGAGGGTTTL